MKKYVVLLLSVLFIADCAAQTPTPSVSKTTYLRLKKYNSGARYIADSLNWNMDQIDAGWKTNDTRLDAHDVDIASLDSAIAQNNTWVTGLSDSVGAVWVNGLYTKVWAGSSPMVHTSYNVNQEQVMFYNAGSSTLTLVDNANIHTITGNDCVLATGESAIFVKKYTSYWQEVYRSNLSEIIPIYAPTNNERILYNDFVNSAIDSTDPSINFYRLTAVQGTGLSRDLCQFVYFKKPGDTQLSISYQVRCTNYSSVTMVSMSFGLKINNTSTNMQNLNDASVGDSYVTKTHTIDVSGYTDNTFYLMDLIMHVFVGLLNGQTCLMEVRYPTVSVR